MAARPWHTAFAILALAIGIGANTGVFSVVNALLLRSLPFRDADRLAALQVFFPPLDSLSIFTIGARIATISSTPPSGKPATSTWAGPANGTQPAIGRAFAPGEEVEGNGWGSPGPNAIAVISYGLWQGLYGGDRRVLGSIIRIDGNPLTIIGVAPPGFDYPEQTVI